MWPIGRADPRTHGGAMRLDRFFSHTVRQIAGPGLTDNETRTDS
jgi:hypothetical protein